MMQAIVAEYMIRVVEHSTVKRITVRLALMLLFVLPNSAALAYTPHVQSTDPNQNIYVDVECHSGTPPVLEFVINAPEDLVRSVSIDFESDGTYDVSIRNPEKVFFRGVPFRAPGTYRSTVYVHTKEGNFTREIIIAFTDFVWGRDNYQFANDGKFEDAGDFVSDTLIEWAESRFGDLDEEQKVLLLTVMYDLYKGSIGRCYGFTGEQIYYMNFPERLPEQYDSLYSLREDDAEIYRNMDHVQNDIVFANFISGKIVIEERQNREDLLHELSIIKHSIEQKQPIIIGYLSKRMHHSMVVYGYFENVFRNKVTLLTANNWEREQNNNVFSEDAENIVIELRGDTPYLSWYDLTKKRYRYPKRIFAVQRTENYDLLLNDFLWLLEKTRQRIVESDIRIIIVEKTEVAMIQDAAGLKQGYSKPRYFREIDGASFKKIDYNYIFELPADQEFRLVLKKRRFNKQLDQYKQVNLFSVVADADGVHAGILHDLPVDDDQELEMVVNRKGVHLKQ
jgi:hypothetical protein